MFSIIDNFFLGLERKKAQTKTTSKPQKTAFSLGSALISVFLNSREPKGIKGLDGWRDEKEKFKLDLINDIKTFLFSKWEKPWKAHLLFDAKGDIISGFRHVSGRFYSEKGNILSLKTNRGKSPFFATIESIDKQKATITDKSKITCIISFIPIYDGKGEKTSAEQQKGVKPKWMMPKFHDVINVDYVDGIKKPAFKEIKFEALELNQYVENFLKQLQTKKRIPQLIYDQADQAFYRYTLDFSSESINLVQINAFKNIESYYSTLFHEITHSTKNPKRLGREVGKWAMKWRNWLQKWAQ